jgi:hypothetical protein
MALKWPVQQSAIPWYAKVALLFKRPRYACDFGGYDHSCVLTYKRLFGVTYVVDCKTFKREDYGITSKNG